MKIAIISEDCSLTDDPIKCGDKEYMKVTGTTTTLLGWHDAVILVCDNNHNQEKVIVRASVGIISQIANILRSNFPVLGMPSLFRPSPFPAIAVRGNPHMIYDSLAKASL